MQTRQRIDSVDVLRGIIMVLMALDHVRDFFGDVAANPTNLATTTVPLFFTRWVTHFCAPVFFLLTGTGAYLASRRRTRSNLAWFLFTRGLWLVFLELTAARLLWQFNVDYQLTILTVFWAIGWSLVALSALVFLPTRAVAAIGIAMILGHNLLDAVRTPVWSALHSPNVAVIGGHTVFSAYPLVPWIGVTAAGYGLGVIFDWPRERRRAFLLRLGLTAIVAFVVLRFTNVYGDPRPWKAQPTAAMTLVAFLNLNKYPPSLLFLLMTLGPAMLVLRALDDGTPRVLRPALIFGRVPFFYYMMHVLVMHVVAVVACLARFGPGAVHFMFESPTLDKFPVTQPPGWPVSLPVVYLIWMGVVLVLYPLCKWFAGVRARRSDAWLSYL